MTQSGKGNSPDDSPQPADNGWRAIAADAINADDGISIFGVIRKLARAPVDGAIELAENPAYRGHQKFFATCLTMWISFGLVVVPWFVAQYFDDETANSDTRVAALKITITQYFELAVIVVAGFFVYRLGATIKRAPLSYYKFTLLGSGLALLLSIVLLTVRMLGIAVIIETLGDLGSEIVELPWLILLVNALTLIVALVLLAALNKRYWGLRTRFVIPATIAVAAIDLAALALVAQLLQVPAVSNLLQILS
ncbi:MAG TPA: hypothetical protein PLD46_00855 [Hyphomicrobium sp.]|nr:hypothetical protein [Hyphomicrobium sp.]